MQRAYDGINGKTVVKLEDVELVYNSEIGTVTALAQVNLDIQEGEFICVMGPSGCGKSTLLNIISGFMQPTDGQALMNGKPIEGPDWQRGVVFQSPPLYPWLTIKENVNFGLRMRNIPEKEREAITAEYLEIVGLTDFANRKPYELSGGMKQRASLAKVLVNEPGMILMDEPFGALDALTRDKMQALIRRIWMKNQSTVFFITHDVDEALSLATKVIVMSSRPGRIVKVLDTDFTYDMDGANSESARYSKQYMTMRESILNVINQKDELAV